MSASRPAVAVGAVVVADERLLMVRRANGPAAGTWSIPGGHIEPGELVVEAVVREVGEETGVPVVCGPLMGYAEIIDDDHHVVILDFEATTLENSEPAAGGDAAEAAWVPVVDVCDLRLAPGLAGFLHEHGVIPTIALD